MHISKYYGTSAQETTKKHWREIALKPEAFEEFLLGEECGFESVEHLGTPEAKSKGEDTVA